LWPSKSKHTTGPVPFTKNAKSIPESGKKKSIIPSMLELGTTNNTETDSARTPKVNSFYE
jgi:hypothetical protein